MVVLDGHDGLYGGWSWWVVFGVGIGAEESPHDAVCEFSSFPICDLAGLFDVGWDGTAAAVAVSQAEQRADGRGCGVCSDGGGVGGSVVGFGG